MPTLCFLPPLSCRTPPIERTVLALSDSASDTSSQGNRVPERAKLSFQPTESAAEGSALSPATELSFREHAGSRMPPQRVEMGEGRTPRPRPLTVSHPRASSALCNLAGPNAHRRASGLASPWIFGPPTGRSADRSPANFALPGPWGGDREDAH